MEIIATPSRRSGEHRDAGDLGPPASGGRRIPAQERVIDHRHRNHHDNDAIFSLPNASTRRGHRRFGAGAGVAKELHLRDHRHRDTRRWVSCIAAVSHGQEDSQRRRSDETDAKPETKSRLPDSTAGRWLPGFQSSGCPPSPLPLTPTCICPAGVCLCVCIHDSAERKGKTMENVAMEFRAWPMAGRNTVDEVERSSAIGFG